MKMLKDTTKLTSTIHKADSKEYSTDANKSTNWFMWLAIVELGVIAFLLLRLSRKNKPGIREEAMKKFKTDSIKDNVDFNNIVASSFQSTKLYDQLKVKCHPDRFLDEEQNKKANKIFQEITKNQRNVKRLLELKEEAEQQLSINF